MEVQGKIKLIGETQEFGSNGFRKRESCSNYSRAISAIYNGRVCSRQNRLAK